MGILAQSMRELVTSMEENEKRQRELLANDLQSIADRLDDVQQALTQACKDFDD